MKNNIIVPIVISAILFGAGGFFGGMKYQQNKRPTMRFNGQVPGQQNRGGARPVAGEIVTVDATSITVKLMDGSSKVVLLTDKTMINKSSTGDKTDLTTGAKVSVFGTENDGGSITAQNIQLGEFRGPMGSPSGTPAK